MNSDLYVSEDGFYFDDFRVLVNYTTSIDENELQNTFNIYPNPASTYLQINTNFQSNNNTVEIFNQTGQIVARENINASNSSIDISNLAAGIYIISLVDNNGNSKRKKLIINR